MRARMALARQTKKRVFLGKFSTTLILSFICRSGKKLKPQGAYFTSSAKQDANI